MGRRQNHQHLHKYCKLQLFSTQRAPRKRQHGQLIASEGGSSSIDIARPPSICVANNNCTPPSTHGEQKQFLPQTITSSQQNALARQLFPGPGQTNSKKKRVQISTNSEQKSVCAQVPTAKDCRRTCNSSVARVGDDSQTNGGRGSEGGQGSTRLKKHNSFQTDPFVTPEKPVESVQQKLDAKRSTKSGASRKLGPQTLTILPPRHDLFRPFDRLAQEEGDTDVEAIAYDQRDAVESVRDAVCWLKCNVLPSDSRRIKWMCSRDRFESTIAF